MSGGYDDINAPVGTRFEPETIVVHADVHNVETVTLQSLNAVPSTTTADDTDLKAMRVSSLMDTSAVQTQRSLTEVLNGGEGGVKN